MLGSLPALIRRGAQEDLRLRPIGEPRSALLRLVVGVSGILFSEALAEESRVVFAKACDVDGSSPRWLGRAAMIGPPKRYEPGRSEGDDGLEQR